MLTWILAAAVAATAGYLIWRLLRDQSEYPSRGSGSGSGKPSSSVWEEDQFLQELRESEEENKRRRQAESRNAVRELLIAGDPQMVSLLSEEAGVDIGSPRLAAEEDEMIRRIAERLGPDTLAVFRSAGRAADQLDSIELVTTRELEPSSHPADQFEVEPMLSDSQLGDVVPEQLALDDFAFYAELASDGLTVTKHYRQVQKKKRIYILLDVSGSMDRPMRDGMMRILWAAGVALKLMMRALAGEAEFLLRYFGTQPYDLYVVRTPQQAKQMAQSLLRLRDWGVGTDIQRALETVVRDIRESTDPDVTTSDVLLVSDGESHIDEQWLEETLKGGIRLHVAMIGLENSLLMRHATSYNVYR